MTFSEKNIAYLFLSELANYIFPLANCGPASGILKGLLDIKISVKQRNLPDMC